MDPFEAFCAAVRHFAKGELERAAHRADEIAPPGDLYAQAARWLDRAARGAEGGAYSDPEGFSAYGRGRSAQAFLEARVELLTGEWRGATPATVLDVGVGDGVVLARAVERAGLVHPPTFDLVEPASGLLARASSAMEALHPRPPMRVHAASIQDFAARAAEGDRWDLAQALVSLQSLERAARAPVLARLRTRADRLIVAEFDVTLGRLDLLSRERIRRVHDRYLEGLAEYADPVDADTREKAVQGFLMPMLFGYFAPGEARSNDEQPIEDWARELEGAGFAIERCEPIAEHWWAAPCAIVAS